jgi:ribosome-binding protein aMBF1 (putative translation factor)
MPVMKRIACMDCLLKGEAEEHELTTTCVLCGKEIDRHFIVGDYILMICQKCYDRNAKTIKQKLG